MDHNEALRLQAAEKYVLGELPGALRKEFEEHFFDCTECAHEIKTAALFADNAREVLQQEAGKEAEKRSAPLTSGWFGWLRPMVAVPVMAVLLLVLGYQTLVTVPHWKDAARQAARPRVLPMYSLARANTRSGEAQTIQGRAGEPIGLYVDVPTEAAYARYALRLEEPDGKTAVLRTVSYSEAQRPVVVQLTPGDRSGAYQIVVLGLAAETAEPAQGTMLARLKIKIELL